MGNEIDRLKQKWFLPESNVESTDFWCYDTSDFNSPPKIYVTLLEYYNRLFQLISSLGRSDELLIIGWSIFDQLDLVKGIADKDSPTSVLSMLYKAVNAGVIVRILLSENPNFNNEIKDPSKSKTRRKKDDLENLLKIPNLKLKLDASAPEYHQKAVYIKQKNNEFLFLGGMDIEAAASGQTDVQIEFTDAQAQLGYLSLIERWNNVAQSNEKLNISNKIIGSSGDAFSIQFIRTYPSQIEYYDNKRNFAKDGDFTYYHLVHNAIKNASKSIYIEDQFLLSMGSELIQGINSLSGNSLKRSSLPVKANPSIDMVLIPFVTRHLNTSLLVGSNFFSTEKPENYNNLNRIISRMVTKTKSPVYKYNSSLNNTPYLHSKVMIIDDELIIIGSANYWHQSFIDSQFAVGEFGVAIIANPYLKGNYFGFNNIAFAKGLRLRMWERLRQSIEPKFNFPKEIVMKPFSEQLFMLNEGVILNNGKKGNLFEHL